MLCTVQAFVNVMTAVAGNREVRKYCIPNREVVHAHVTVAKLLWSLDLLTVCNHDQLHGRHGWNCLRYLDKLVMQSG